MTVAKQMKSFEDTIYANWKAEVENKLPGLLKHNLLCKAVSDTTKNTSQTTEQKTGQWLYKIFVCFSKNNSHFFFFFYPNQVKVVSQNQ